jgi:uncharacterized protein YutE (UPF0331/DUF86 family)
MKIERAGRYKDKLNLVSKRVEQVQGWLQQISAEEFLEDDKTRLASYKAFQEAVEACLDLVAMICAKTPEWCPKMTTATWRLWENCRKMPEFC